MAFKWVMCFMAMCVMCKIVYHLKIANTVIQYVSDTTCSFVSFVAKVRKRLINKLTGEPKTIRNDAASIPQPDFDQVLGNDFKCSICMDIFTIPTTINCGHTFCRGCIIKWALRIGSCPFCREITHSFTLSTTINSYIGNMIEKHGSPEIWEHRAEILLELKDKY